MKLYFYIMQAKLEHRLRAIKRSIGLHLTVGIIRTYDFFTELSLCWREYKRLRRAEKERRRKLAVSYHSPSPGTITLEQNSKDVA